MMACLVGTRVLTKLDIYGDYLAVVLTFFAEKGKWKLVWREKQSTLYYRIMMSMAVEGKEKKVRYS